MELSQAIGRLECDIIARGWIDVLRIDGKYVDFLVHRTAEERIPTPEARKELQQSFSDWQRRRRDLWARASVTQRHILRRMRNHNSYPQDLGAGGKHPYHMVPVLSNFQWSWAGVQRPLGPQDELILRDVFTDSYYASHDRTSSAMYVAMQELLTLMGISEEESQYYAVEKTGGWCLTNPRGPGGYHPPYGITRFDLYKLN